VRVAKILLIVPFCLILALAIFALTAPWHFRNFGVVKTVGITAYWTSNCTSPVTQVDWGVLTLGEAKTVTIYIRNEGNTHVNLTMNVENWNPPEAANLITLNWNYTGQKLQPNMTLPIALTLTVGNEPPSFSNFSFEIWITAYEKEE